MKKRIFETVQEAVLALHSDALGVAYVNVSEVFVITAYGTGKFTRAEWERGKNEPCQSN